MQALITHRRVSRAGFTLPELAVSLSLAMLLAASLLALVRGQQRFYRRSASTLDTRAQLRQGIAVLATELRGVSPGQGDIARALRDTLELRSTLGAAVSCDRGANWLAVAAPPASGVGAMTGWLVRPRDGDTVWVLDPGLHPPPSRQWRPHTIARLDADASLCVASVFAAPGGGPAFRIAVAEPLDSAAPREGLVLRFTRHIRLALYRRHDGAWHLGIDEIRSGSWTGIQPVSGPYDAPRGSPGAGFRYFDSAGGELSPPAEGVRIRRVEVALASPSPARSTQDVGRDSMRIDIAPRNDR